MGPLVDVTELAALLARREPERPVVVDVRWTLGGPDARALYDAGHVPGAVFADLPTDLAGPPRPGGAGGRHPLPEPAALQATLRRLGVRSDGAVVVYDTADGSVAARLWWLLRWAGHDAVAVLDGGFAAWVASGRPTSAEEPRVEPGDVVVRPGAMPVLDADAAAVLASGGGVLVDVRAAARYRGDTEPVDPRAGHIPGAVNGPFAEHVGPDGRWRAPADLARRFDALGARPGVAVGVCCGSGVTATSAVLALEIAGVAGAALYPGSWSEWSADPARPAATGPTP